MKRLISMGITVALLFSMCACGGKSSDKGSETEGKKIFTRYDLETQNFAEAFNEEEIYELTDDKDLWKMADKIVEGNKKENNSKVNIIPSETKNIV